MKREKQQLSAAELARLLGVQRSTITQWRDAGCPQNNGQFEPSEWFAWYRQRNQVRSADSAPGSKADQAVDELLRLRRAKRRREELRLAADRRRLIDVERVITVMAQHVTDARILCTAIPDRIAVFVGDEAERKHVRSEAVRIVNDALRALAKGQTAIKK